MHSPEYLLCSNIMHECILVVVLFRSKGAVTMLEVSQSFSATSQSALQQAQIAKCRRWRALLVSKPLAHGVLCSNTNPLAFQCQDALFKRDDANVDVSARRIACVRTRFLLEFGFCGHVFFLAGVNGPAPLMCVWF